MKHTRKILVALLVLVTLLMSMAMINSFAADDVIIYLTPNSNWRSDNARFAMYVWIEDGDYRWIDMIDSDGDGIYEGALPAGYTNIIFCRMDPNKTNGWSDNKTWNQTDDLVYDGINNHYTVSSGAWSKGEGKWSVYDSNACAHSYGDDSICTKCGAELFYIIAGNVMKEDDVYREGDNSTLFVSKWDETDENNKMEYDSEAGCYVKIYKNVAAGEYHFKVAENKSWDVSYGDNGGNCYIKVDEDGSTVTIAFKDGSVTSAVSVPKEPIKPDDSTDIDNNDKNEQSDGSQNNGSDKDSNHTPAPDTELNFFQRIWLAIVNFFKNLFGGKK
ncbi:MAG: hypothetical protein J6V80_01440 [Clostridia bacterium]|nr:hypothetical protein [Clostridia bacterium]